MISNEPPIPESNLDCCWQPAMDVEDFLGLFSGHANKLAILASMLKIIKEEELCLRCRLWILGPLRSLCRVCVGLKSFRTQRSEWIYCSLADEKVSESQRREQNPSSVLDLNWLGFHSAATSCYVMQILQLHSQRKWIGIFVIWFNWDLESNSLIMCCCRK